jgi:photosystem II stability/assembly factor-like uncharacterized protein
MNNKVLQLIVLFSLLSFSQINAEWKKLIDKEGPFIAFDNIILLSADYGVYRSVDYGETWTFNETGEIDSVKIGISKFSMNDRYIFASTNAGIYISADTGKSWQPVGPAPGGQTLYMISVFADDSVVLASMAGGGLFRSGDMGDNWTYLGPYRNYDYIKNNDTIFAAAMDGLWYSADRGENWILCKEFDIWPFYISVVSFARNNRYIFANAFDRLFRLEDESAWGRLETDLLAENKSLSAIYGIDNYLFAGLSDNKVYLSSDNGIRWKDISSNRDNISSVSGFGNSGSNLLVAKDGCLWSVDIDEYTGITMPAVPAPSEYLLLQNYPNPFNPSTRITYNIPQTEFVTLTVYDILGRKVGTLVNEIKEKGEYTVNFNAENLSSGTYIYRLKTGNFSSAKKLIIAR